MNSSDNCIGNLLRVCLFCILSGFSYGQQGKDGSLTISTTNTIINKYSPLTADASMGSTLLNIGSSASFANGDLVMIIQMQGASIKGYVQDSTWGQVTNYNNSGNNEFKEVLSVPNATQLMLTCPLQNNYTASGSVQVIRVARYNTLTITNAGSITSPSWNGSIGGVLAIESIGNITINGVIQVNGQGFRGGAADNDANFPGGSAYYSTSDFDGSAKGESIAGYGAGYNVYGGSICRGAPANGGGGGNAHNSGGGGGANGGVIALWNGKGNPAPGFNAAWNLEGGNFSSSTSSGGGRGGYSFTASQQNTTTLPPGNANWGGDNRRIVGGLGGRPMDYSTGRLFVGGGGGSGDSNNGFGQNGGNGGGLVYIQSYSNINGSGSIQANGNNLGFNAAQGVNGVDGESGGGGGGTIILNSSGTISGISASATGGSGGSQNVTGEAEGPGGGGGGGYIALSTIGIVTNVSGGVNGTTNSNILVPAFPPNGSTKGGSGSVVPISNFDFTLTATSSTICIGYIATLTATISGAGSPAAPTYSWWDSPSGGIQLAVGSTFTVSPVTTTTYYAAVCPSIKDRVPAIVNVNTATVTSAPATICFGQQSILTANSSNSYQWSTGATTNTINVSPTATATYTVIGNSLGCFDTTTATITVNPLPIVKITSDTICDGQGRAGILQASGANSYLWQTGATTYSISASPNTTTTYSVVGNSLGCLDTATATIKVNPLPILTITLDTICKAQGRAGTITVSGANSYLWSTGATTSSISDAPLVTMTYTVTGTTLGCFSSATSTITVNPIPVVTVAPATICIGQSVTLTAASANLYRWSTGATTNTINISPAITSTYSVIGNSLGCLDSTSAIIRVNPIPIVTATSDTICNGQGRAGILKASGADTYVWSTGAATYSMTASPNITTTYTVTGNTLGCLNTAKGIIKVNPLPPVSSTSKTICRGQTATLVASGAVSYLWSNGVAFSANTVSPASTTTYTLTGTTLGCFNTVTANVTVNPYPIVTVNSVTVCTGGSATLKAVGANSYLWSTGATNDSIVQTPLAGTNYTVTGTSFNCSKKAIGSITVLNATQAVAVPQSICFGDTTSLVAYGSSSYTWSYNSTTSSANPLVVSPKVNTTYTVIGLGCPNSGTVTVSVLPLPIITVLPKTICEGNTATLLAKDSLHNISTYIWSTGSDSASIIATPKDSLTIYTVVGATVFGCKDTTMVSITVKPNPVVSVNSAVICPNAGSTLTAVGAATYLWSTGATTNFITASPITTTSYSVTGYSPWGCSGKGIGTIKMSKNPTAGFIASPSPTDVFNTEVAFSNTSSVDVVYWHWDYGDGNTLAPNTASPIHTYAEDVGTYTVTLIVHNATPCWDTISSEILIGPEYAYYIPNSFTPNGDKNNNGFRGVGIGIVKYKLEIFDRWGQFIWQSTDLDEYWDGIVTGGTRIVQEDVYVWKVFITDVFGREHHYIGTVTVVK